MDNIDYIKNEDNKDHRIRIEAYIRTGNCKKAEKDEDKQIRKEAYSYTIIDPLGANDKSF